MLCSQLSCKTDGLSLDSSRVEPITKLSLSILLKETLLQPGSLEKDRRGSTFGWVW